MSVEQPSRGSFQFHSFQGSFFLENPQHPGEMDPVFEKNDGSKKMEKESTARSRDAATWLFPLHP